MTKVLKFERWSYRRLILIALAVVPWVSCGLDTDADGDGFYNSALIEGDYLYDCYPDDENRHEGLPYFRDGDEDGYGNPAVVCYVCISAAEELPTSLNFVTDTACEPDVRYVFNSLDCNDEEETLREGRTWYRDSDGDTLGDPNLELSVITCPEGPNDVPPEGYTDNTLDCDDNTKSPDGFTGRATVYYFDDDGDTYGGRFPFISCSPVPEEGYVTNTLDCDDFTDEVNPGISYDCFESGRPVRDNDCDGLLDEDEGVTWYADIDEDNFGDTATGRLVCEPPEGWTQQPGDCDDEDPNIYPGSSGCNG